MHRLRLAHHLFLFANNCRRIASAGHGKETDSSCALLRRLPKASSHIVTVHFFSPTIIVILNRVTANLVSSLDSCLQPPRLVSVANCLTPLINSQLTRCYGSA